MNSHQIVEIQLHTKPIELGEDSELYTQIKNFLQERFEGVVNAFKLNVEDLCNSKDICTTWTKILVDEFHIPIEVRTIQSCRNNQLLFDAWTVGVYLYVDQHCVDTYKNMNSRNLEQLLDKLYGDK